MITHRKTLRKFWINDMVIIAPLKCATRWLTGKAWKSQLIPLKYLVEETHSSHYFLYREGISHLESAILTDYVTNGGDLSLTVHNLLTNRSNHWCSNLWEYIHRAWCYNKFQMVEYSEVSNLIGDWDADLNGFDFSKHPPFITKEMVLNMIDSQTLTTLYEGADNNNHWLQQILNGNDKILSKSVIDMLASEVYGKLI